MLQVKAPIRMEKTGIVQASQVTLSALALAGMMGPDGHVGTYTPVVSLYIYII